MTQASHFLFTLAECWAHQQSPHPCPIGDAVRSAVAMVESSPLACIICGEMLEGTASYLSLILPSDLTWGPALRRRLHPLWGEARAPMAAAPGRGPRPFAFGEPMGNA